MQIPEFLESPSEAAWEAVKAKHKELQGLAYWEMFDREKWGRAKEADGKRAGNLIKALSPHESDMAPSGLVCAVTTASLSEC